MDNKSEVFLGQKKSIARYDLEQQKPTWSQKIDGIPGSITTYNDYLLFKALINGKQNMFIICLMPTRGSCFGKAMKLNLI